MTKRELFLALFPNEKACWGNRKYKRLTRSQLLKMYWAKEADKLQDWQLKADMDYTNTKGVLNEQSK